MQNVIERAVILCGDNGMLEPEHLGMTPGPVASEKTSEGVSVPGNGENTESITLAELEKRHILAALEQCKGNRTHAAKLLDVSIRTLRNKLHEYHGTSPKSDDDPAEA